MCETYKELQPPPGLKSVTTGNLPAWEQKDFVDLGRNSGSINSVTWDSQGRHLLSGGKDATIRVSCCHQFRQQPNVLTEFVYG